MESSDPCLFITGTGTDVGKTYTTRVIVSELFEREVNFGVVKSVASGCRSLPEEEWYVSDLAFIREELPESEWFRLGCGGYYQRPVSPLSAVRKGEPTVSYESICSRINAYKEKFDSLLVEGIGGVMVPLTKEKSVYDLICDVATHVVIVGTRQLGQINSFLLSWEKICQTFSKKKIALVFSDVSNEYEYVSDDLQTQEVVLDLLDTHQYGHLSHFSDKIDWNESFSLQSFLSS